MKKLLIIEDDQIVGTIYRHKFRAEGFQVELATDGEAGLKAVASFEPSIVILDLMLPKLNGVEVLKRLRERHESRGLPVIVLTNAYMSTLVQDAWRAGANHCMIKANCSPKQLVELVNKTLGINSAPAAPVTSPVQQPATVVPTDKAAALSSEDKPKGSDTAFQTQVRQDFLITVPDQISELRALLQAFAKSDGEAARLTNLFTLYRKLHTLASNAAVSGLTTAAEMSSALEALLKELYEKPKNINGSSIRTIAQSIDFISVLFEQKTNAGPIGAGSPGILVVDDDPFSRRAMVVALEKASLKCVDLEDPMAALQLLSEKRFDLIFLDVNMPAMTGFDLCEKIRAIPQQSKTPVIFVTGLTDFESRTRSTLSGGADLIAKPFLFMELAVKALTHLMKAQLGAAKS